MNSRAPQHPRNYLGGPTSPSDTFPAKPGPCTGPSHALVEAPTATVSGVIAASQDRAGEGLWKWVCTHWPSLQFHSFILPVPTLTAQGNAKNALHDASARRSKSCLGSALANTQKARSRYAQRQLLHLTASMHFLLISLEALLLLEQL